MSAHGYDIKWKTVLALRQGRNNMPCIGVVYGQWRGYVFLRFKHGHTTRVRECDVLAIVEDD